MMAHILQAAAVKTRSGGALTGLFSHGSSLISRLITWIKPKITELICSIS